MGAYIKITTWLASAYDFYARTNAGVSAANGEFSNLSQQVHNRNRTNEPTINSLFFVMRMEISLTLETCQRFISSLFGLRPYVVR